MIGQGDYTELGPWPRIWPRGTLGSGLLHEAVHDIGKCFALNCREPWGCRDGHLVQGILKLRLYDSGSGVWAGQ